MPETVSFSAFGGLNEVGSNGYMYRSGDEILIIDCCLEIGLTSSKEEVLEYLKIPEACKIVGVCITHPHLDHLKDAATIANIFRIPIFTSELGEKFLKSYIDKNPEITEVPEICLFRDKEIFSLGNNFEILPFEVAHSVPDSFGFNIKTKGKNIIHTGECKLTGYKLSSRAKNLEFLQQLGQEKVDLLIQDTLCINRKGVMYPEEPVVLKLLDLISEAPDNRHFIFASSKNLRRIINIWMRLFADGVNVIFKGGAMYRMSNIVGEVVNQENVHNQFRKTNTHKHVFFGTGCQGEENSFITKLAKLTCFPRLEKGDRVYISSTLIPSEDELVFKAKIKRFREIIQDIQREGAEVYVHYGQNKLLDLAGYVKTAKLHVGGHEFRDGIEYIVRAIRPLKFVGSNTPKERTPLVRWMINEMNQFEEENRNYSSGHQIEHLEVKNFQVVEL
ncbi:MBL fold metallo-hydrolase [Patescibacteria group bacterium]